MTASSRYGVHHLRQWLKSSASGESIIVITMTGDHGITTGRGRIIWPCDLSGMQLLEEKVCLLTIANAVPVVDCFEMVYSNAKDFRQEILHVLTSDMIRLLSSTCEGIHMLQVGPFPLHRSTVVSRYWSAICMVP